MEGRVKIFQFLQKKSSKLEKTDGNLLVPPLSLGNIWCLLLNHLSPKFAALPPPLASLFPFSVFVC